MTIPEIGNADCHDTELMLRLWHGGPACRDAALDLAEQNRRSTLTAGKSDAPAKTNQRKDAA